MKSLITNIRRGITTFRAPRKPSLAVRAALLVLCGQGLLAVEGPIVAVQETLKKQQFFFGECNGLMDEPTRTALRRFQIRHGLDSTGELDSVTMSALQRPSLPPPSAAPSTPVVEKDREFLAGLQEGRAPVSTPHPGTPAEPSAPPPTAPVPAVVEIEPPAPVVPAAPPKPRLTQLAPPPAPVERPAPQVSAAAPVTKVTAPMPVTTATARHVSVVEADGAAEVAASVESPWRASVARSESMKRELAVPTNRRVEQPRWVPTPQSERSPAARTAAAPQRVADPRVSSAKTRIVESDTDESDEPAGTRITRTVTTGPDGQTYITVRKTTTVSGSAITIRAGEPVEPRHRTGLFSRLFKGY